MSALDVPTVATGYSLSPKLGRPPPPPHETNVAAIAASIIIFFIFILTNLLFLNTYFVQLCENPNSFASFQTAKVQKSIYIYIKGTLYLTNFIKG
jgi:hypothetical protein